MIVLLVFLCTTGSYAQEGETIAGKKTMRDLRKNSVYAELFGVGVFWSIINYDRIIPITDKVAIAPRVGLTYYEELFPVAELNFLAGGVHSFEAGVGTPFISWEGTAVVFRAGYRYQGLKGFLFRAAPEYFTGLDEDNSLWLAIALGYCF